ncbi:MAG TPA: DUF1015 family protein, partial [Thermoplasmataceae archaeon]|nr:DUF1015 family protein [Thermoplasmataceae archaeon]
MVQIKPFKPFTFNEGLQNVVSPPFDSIPPNLEKVLKLNGHNITHLTLPETDPGALLRRWVGSGIIKPVKDDSILVLDQYYTWNGKMMRIT